MRNIIAATLAISLLGSTVALADRHRDYDAQQFAAKDNRDRQDQWRQQQQQQDQWRQQQQQQDQWRQQQQQQDQRRQQQQQQDQWRKQRQQQDQWRQQQDWQRDRSDDRYRNNRYDWNDYRPGRRPPQWDQYNRNFDPRPYEGNWRAARRYRWQPYYPLRGWYYRTWVYGQFLPYVYWGRDYWLDDYWQFGLIDPPYGYVWVRYFDDALMVNIINGQILTVVYGVFY